MKIKNLTIAQLKKALSNNKYLIIRERSGKRYAVNCAILKTKQMNRVKILHPNKATRVLSYMPCDFQEYITLKIPFI